MQNDLHLKLKQLFGFDQFKGDQEQIIRSLLDGHDTFVIMPTGGGKSLCYQLPAMICEGTAIVVSPLIALMKNQVDAIRGFVSGNEGVAHFLNSSLTKAQMAEVKEDLLSGVTKILYVAPESLTKAENISFFKELKISFYAIDEAHCISEWGHDFRPEYRRIRPIINEIGDAPVIALTATATNKVRDDIKKNLGIQDAKDFADETIRKINKLGQRSGNIAELEEERRKTREKLSGVTPKTEAAKVRKGGHKATDFHIGDSVLVLSMNMKGTIHSLPNAKGDCFVTMGIMTTKVNISDLAILEEPKTETKKKAYTPTGMGAKAMTISPELNLVGKRVDEAIAELDKYLDDAYLAHLAKVTIIHGRGTGAVRQAVHSHCKKTKYVKALTLSPDYGSTEVEFKE